MAESIESLKELLKKYEENGVAKLYYSLNRKAWEMAAALNLYNLEDLDMMSKSDATFERVFKLLEKSETIASAASGLGTIAGVTGNEKKDIERKPFVDRIAEKRD